MKKIKIKIVCTIVLLVSVAPIRCMFRRVTSWRPATSGMSREVAARLAAAQQAERLPNALPIRDTSTLSGLFQSMGDRLWSLFQRSSVQPQVAQPISYASVRTMPSGARGFSTATPQKASFLDKIRSYFAPSIPQEEKLTGEDVNHLVWGHIDWDWVNAWGDKVGRMVFDKNDLQVAQEKLARFLQKNPEYKTDPIVKDYEYHFKFRSGRRNIDFTILDICFLRLFEGDENRFTNPVKMSPSDSSLNQIELIKYLIDIGAQINPANNEMYKKAYRDLLNNWSYQALYESNTQTLYGIEYEIQKFKEIFKELDPILEKIIPGFKPELEAIQKERSEIESNPEAYRKKVEDAENRRAYKYAKARQMSNDYNRRTGDAYASYPYDFSDKVKFDEQEYQEWLKGGKNTSFFGFDNQIFSQEEAKPIWELLPGLTSTSSKEDITKAFRKYSKENHEDVLNALVKEGKMTKKDADEKKATYKKVTAAWNDYNEKLKQQQATE